MTISRVRMDDILWESSDIKIKGKELDRFKRQLSWCYDADLLVVPAILCQEIEKFPKAIEFIKEELKEGKLITIDLHGFNHGPYQDRSYEEVKEHLDKAIEWFDNNLNLYPIRWVTPHGSNSLIMQEAAKEFNLLIETTDFPVLDQRAADNLLRKNKDLNVLENRIIMNHFWERGLALYRVCQIYKYGSIEEAIKNSKLNEQERKKCWGGWF